jgi:VWFA-related protein
MTAMPPGDQSRALAAVEKFIRTQMTPADLLAILRYAGGAVDVLQDFTADHDRLLSIVQTMIVGEGQGMDYSTDDASSADTGAAFGQDDSEFNIFNTDRQLSALQTAANMLGQLNEKKSLIYFASGLRLNGLNNQAQLHATINAAIRAGVSFWPIDARGLVAQAPLGDATMGSPGNAGMYSGAAALAVTTNLQQSQDTLYALGCDTGGKALLDYNDLAKGILQAAQSVSSYYIIGYYTSNTAQDGKFRRIKIALNAELAATLDYRQGYFAGKIFGKFTAADKERQLEDALMLPDPITELTIAMEVDYFQLNRAEYFVPIVVKIPGRELALAKRGGAERTLIDFVGEIKDNYGTTITNVRDKVDIRLSDATAAELVKRPIEYDAGFTLLPGKYTIKFLARDAETGRIGTYQTTFLIPNLNKEEKRVPISSVVLSSQRVDLKDALYNAVKGKDRSETANPLVRDGHKLIPSVTRVFSKGREMYVYLQAYAQGAADVQALIAFVSLYAGQKESFRNPADRGSERSGEPAKHDAYPIQHRARQSSARQVRLPGDGARSNWDRRRRFGRLLSWLCRNDTLHRHQRLLLHLLGHAAHAAGVTGKTIILRRPAAAGYVRGSAGFGAGAGFDAGAGFCAGAGLSTGAGVSFRPGGLASGCVAARVAPPRFCDSANCRALVSRMFFIVSGWRAHSTPCSSGAP